jgi:flagellar basal body rod protein FlgG
VFLNPALSSALDRIAERANDVRRAFIPGALPAYDDVATGRSSGEPALDPLSVVAPDDAYFIGKDATGQTVYTRDGSFHLSDGVLVGENEHPVLGFSSPESTLAELRIDPVDVALDRVTNARIEPDGSLSYDRVAIDPRTARRELQRVVAGRIAVARFPVATRLETANGLSFSPPAGVLPHTGVAGEGGFLPLQPMQRERSGVDLDESLARLKAAYVAFDALAAAETAKMHLGKTAVDLVK